MHREVGMMKRQETDIVWLLVSQALVLHYRGFIPVLALGAKLGLANIITMVALVLFGFKEAMAIVNKSCSCPLLGGSVTGILYSLSGGICGIIMSILYQNFRIIFHYGYKYCRAVFHNIGQLLAASWILILVGILYLIYPY